MPPLSFEMHKFSSGTWSAATTGLAPYLAALLLLLLSSALEPRPDQSDIKLTSSSLGESISGPWEGVDLSQVILKNNSAWLKAEFEVPEFEIADGQPLGLFLSGTFSAVAIWNDEEVGNKGQPSQTKLAEIPGNVDAVIHLPANITQAGTNILLLELSSHYKPSGISSIIHRENDLLGIRVGAYSSEHRRSIGYYAAPFLVAGLLLVSVFAFVPKPASSTTINISALAILGFLCIAALAELSRAVMNYSYAFHTPRLWSITIATTCFGASLLFYAMKVSARKFSSKAKFLMVLLVALIALFPPITFVATPLKTITAAAIAGIVLSGQAALLGKPKLWGLCCAFIFLTGFSLIDPGLFLDRGLYAGALPLVAYLIQDQRESLLASDSTPVVAVEDQIVIKSASSEKFVLVEDIVAIHGAGNYSEVELRSGVKNLDDRGLNAFERELPSSFFRIHRSHIANLGCVSALRSLGSGKHQLELNDRVLLPVSRSKVKQLRALIRPS